MLSKSWQVVARFLIFFMLTSHNSVFSSAVLIFPSLCFSLTPLILRLCFSFFICLFLPCRLPTRTFPWQLDTLEPPIIAFLSSKEFFHVVHQGQGCYLRWTSSTSVLERVCMCVSGVSLSDTQTRPKLSKWCRSDVDALSASPVRLLVGVSGS